MRKLITLILIVIMIINTGCKSEIENIDKSIDFIESIKTIPIESLEEDKTSESTKLQITITGTESIEATSSDITTESDVPSIVEGEYFEGCEYYYDNTRNPPQLMKLVANNYNDFLKAYTDAMYEFTSEIAFNTYDDPHKTGDIVNVSFICHHIEYSIFGDNYDSDCNYYLCIEDSAVQYNIDISIKRMLTGGEAINKALELGGDEYELDGYINDGIEIVMINYSWNENIINDNGIYFPDVYIGIADSSGSNRGGFAHSKSEIKITETHSRNSDDCWRLLYVSKDTFTDFKPAILVGDIYQCPPLMRMIYFDAE